MTDDGGAAQILQAGTYADLDLASDAEEPGIRALRLDLYLFFSFDLVGSTKLKVELSDGRMVRWPDLFRRFYKLCGDVGATLGARVWKYVGDEVLLYAKITTKAELECAVERIYAGLAYVIEGIQGDLRISALSVKAATWIAPIGSYATDVSERARNLAVNNPVRDFAILGVRDELDFLGPNIDSGFRLSAYTRRGQLLLSPALAYYLFKVGAVPKGSMKIVNAARLKGVASGDPLPVIWYREDDWSSPTMNRCFTYEERFEDALIMAACLEHTESIERIDEIFAAVSPSGYFFEASFIEDLMESSARA